MNYKKIVVIGGGVLGSQIAFQTAYSGYEVTVLVHSDKTAEDTREKLNKLYKTYVETIKLMATREGKDVSNWARGIPFGDKFDKADCLKRAEYARDNIIISQSQEAALMDADLVIESITENIDAKIELYKSIAPLLPEKTVIVTNSSTLLPSKMAKYTGRSNKYLALHFANSIWKNNIAEVMRQSETHKRYFNQVLEFAKSINMIPLAANEEKSGYLMGILKASFKNICK